MWFEDELEDSTTRPKTESQSAHDEQLKLAERRHLDEQQVREQTTQAQNSEQLSKPNVPKNIEDVSMPNAKSQFPDLNLPTISALKSSFGKGKIPQEADFKHLIDMAAVGCTAMGIVPGSSPTQLGPGLSLTTDNKLMVSAPIMKGMIVMYYGTEQEIPDGWKLCDGREGRPNLLDRFIVGGRMEDSGKGTTESLGGSALNKSFSVRTKMVKINQTLQVSGHQLEREELPSHQHHSSIRYLNYSLRKVSNSVTEEVQLSGDVAKIYRMEPLEIGEYEGMPYYAQWITDGYRVGDQPVFNHVLTEDTFDYYPYSAQSDPFQKVSYDWSSFAGSNKPHSHDIVETGNGHDHGLDVKAPYAILAFIIKV